MTVMLHPRHAGNPGRCPSRAFLGQRPRPNLWRNRSIVTRQPAGPRALVKERGKESVEVAWIAAARFGRLLGISLVAQDPHRILLVVCETLLITTITTWNMC
jgi:hypothetical protein